MGALVTPEPNVANQCLARPRALCYPASARPTVTVTQAATYASPVI